MTQEALANLSNETLLKEIKATAQKLTSFEVSLLLYLNEVRRRKLYLEMGYYSLAAFAKKELSLTEDQCWKRSQAACIIRRWPEFLELLKDGKTEVSHLSLISGSLSEATKNTLLEFIPGKTKQEILSFLKRLNRDGSVQEVPSTTTLTLEVDDEFISLLNQAVTLKMKGKEKVKHEELLKEAMQIWLEKKDPARKNLCRSRAVEDKVEDKNENSHNKSEPNKLENKSCSGAGVEINNASKVTITAPAPEQASTRYISANIRREVFKRDQYRCTYVSVEGYRCEATLKLKATLRWAQ